MNKFVTVLSTLGLAAIVGSAHASSGKELGKDARIGIKQARAIALKAFPGRITGEELEKESGGSGLRYSFDIRKGSAIQEVGVDAVTGRVLENNPEGPNPD
jgi:uncharacterized membrane protein YkoI